MGFFVHEPRIVLEADESISVEYLFICVIFQRVGGIWSTFKQYYVTAFNKVQGIKKYK